MDEARRRQWAIWNGWTPRQKLAAVGRMTATVLALRQAGRNAGRNAVPQAHRTDAAPDA
jgi:hypothetical protein